MEMKKFMDIQRMRDEWFDVIDVGDEIWIEEKIDGANCGIRYDKENDKLVAQSRKRILEIGQDDLRGFGAFVERLNANSEWKDAIIEKIFGGSDQITLFGEWVVKHTIAYSNDVYKNMYCYDMYDEYKGEYLPQEKVYSRVGKCMDMGVPLHLAPVFYTGPFMNWENINEFVGKTMLDASPCGEGCFKSDTKILMADGTQKEIKYIEVGDMVKTYNTQTKEVEDKLVTNVFFNGQKPVAEWNNVAVFPKGTSSRGLINGKMVVTKNHKFFDGEGWTPIENLNYVYHYGPVFDDFRKQAFLGLLVSDIHLSKSIFSLSQVTRNVDDFYNLFKIFISGASKFTSGKGSDMTVLHFQLQSTINFLNTYTENDKILYTKVFESLDEIGWAFFLMGDGSADSKGTIELCLASYTIEECNIAKEAFEKIFNIKTTYKTDERVKNGSGLTLRTTAKDGKIILSKISKYIMPNYRYKIKSVLNPDDFIGIPEFKYGITKRKLHTNKNYTDMATSKGRKTIGAYDIEVADNHNYFANGCLVHNCVIKNQTRLNDPNGRKPFYIKIVTEQFKEVQKSNKVKKDLDPTKLAAEAANMDLAKTIVTEARVRKILNKLVDEGILREDWDETDMPTVAKNLSKRIIEDCVKEENDTVVQIEGFGKCANKICMPIAKEIALGKKG